MRCVLHVVQLEPQNLQLIPPAAGAFWTPLKTPAYDKSLPAQAVLYSDEEKAAQREACIRQYDALHEAMAAGKDG